MKLLKKIMCVQILMLTCFYFFMVTVSTANDTSPKKLVISIVVQDIPEGKLTMGLTKVLCDRMNGIVCEFVSLPSARSLDAFGQGELDIEGPRNSTVETNFSNIVKIPEAIFVNELVAFSKDSNIKLSGWNSLKRFRVAYVRGWKIYENNVKNVKDLEILNHQEALFKFLDEGRTDVILLSRISGLKVISDLSLKGIAAIEPPLVVKNLYLYMNKKHEKLAPIFAKILHDMKSDGTYQQIYDQIIVD